jgi:hypothetical protein
MFMLEYSQCRESGASGTQGLRTTTPKLPLLLTVLIDKAMIALPDIVSVRLLLIIGRLVSTPVEV